MNRCVKHIGQIGQIGQAGRVVLILLLTSALPLMASAQEKPEAPKAIDESQKMELRGHVVCLAEEFERLYHTRPDCEHRGHLYGLKTADGKLYSFLPTDSAAAIYDDQRIRERELQVTARPFPNSGFIEVIKLQSLREGKLYDLYYFCEVCNIESYKPGECVCCHAPVEFREELTEEHSKR